MKHLYTIGVVALTVLAVTQFQSSNEFYTQARLDATEASCALAVQSPTASHLNSCHAMQDTTNTEYICDNDGAHCNLEIK